MLAIEQKLQLITEPVWLLSTITDSNDHTCPFCENDFALTVKVDDFGNRTVIGGESIRDMLVCAECIPAAVDEWAQELAAERAIAYQLASYEGEDEQDKVADAGFYVLEPSPAPDAWPVLSNRQLADTYGLDDSDYAAIEEL